MRIYLNCLSGKIMEVMAIEKKHANLPFLNNVHVSKYRKL